MPLPSQNARSQQPSRSIASGGRPPRGRAMNWTPVALIAGGIAAVIGLVWLAVGSGGSSTTPATSATTPTAAPADTVLATNDPASEPRRRDGVAVGNLGGTPASATTGLIASPGTPSGAPISPAATPAGGSTTPREVAANPGSTPGASPAAVPSATPGATPGQAPASSGAGTPAPSASRPGAPTAPVPGDLADALQAGRQRLAMGDAVAARVLLSRVLADARLPEGEREAVRDDLTRINEDLVFSPRVDPQDPFAYAYAVQSGDSLVRIMRRENLSPDWRLIQRVNGMANPSALSVGRRLKLVRGPFHAVVHKDAYRLDLFMGPAGAPSDWVYVRSFQVGLGEGNSTPLGEFVVRRGSKLINPHWVNPRTGQRFDASDPTNPIGEHWIGLEGVGASATITGYGIHGTIEPESLGQQRSMGCVRLGTEDIALLYELLGEGTSTVRIAP